MTPEEVAREIIRPEVDAQRMVLCGEIQPRMWRDWQIFEPIEHIANKLADKFAADDWKFDRDAWEKACGFLN